MIKGDKEEEGKMRKLSSKKNLWTTVTFKEEDARRCRTSKENPFSGGGNTTTRRSLLHKILAEFPSPLLNTRLSSPPCSLQYIPTPSPSPLARRQVTQSPAASIKSLSHHL